MLIYYVIVEQVGKELFKICHEASTPTLLTFLEMQVLHSL